VKVFFSRMRRMPLVRMLVFLALLLFVVPMLMGAAPPRQDAMPDPNSFALYGVPWALVGLTVVFLLKRYIFLSDEGSVLVAAISTVIGYLVIQNLPDLEVVAPWMPKYVPMVLWALLLFGAQLGLQPGTTARKVAALVARR
jgi:hypothetical protein